MKVSLNVVIGRAENHLNATIANILSQPWCQSSAKTWQMCTHLLRWCCRVQVQSNGCWRVTCVCVCFPLCVSLNTVHPCSPELPRWRLLSSSKAACPAGAGGRDSGIQGMQLSWWYVCITPILSSLPGTLPLYRWISVSMELLCYIYSDWLRLVFDLLIVWVLEICAWFYTPQKFIPNAPRQTDCMYRKQNMDINHKPKGLSAGRTHGHLWTLFQMFRLACFHTRADRLWRARSQ